MGSGVAFLDYDSDGDQDLLLRQLLPLARARSKAGQPPTQALYRNDGKGHFEDVTKEAGLDKTFYGRAWPWATTTTTATPTSTSRPSAAATSSATTARATSTT